MVIRAGSGSCGTVVEELTGTEPWRARLLSTTGGVARVALVQSRASLLAGDDVELAIAVGEGAALELVELGATIAHNVRHGTGALMRAEIRVAARGRLVWLGEPLIVADGASVRRTTTAELAPGARALIGDSVALGRTREHAGALVARTRIAYDGRPTVDETLDTRDRATLRSAVVAGEARMISSLTLAGMRDDRPPPGAMQAHGPATLWRRTGRAAAPDEQTARLAERWRTLVLLDAPALTVPGGDAPSMRFPTNTFAR